MPLLLLLGGCTPASRSPDNVRQNTAVVTAAAARSAKAVAQGVFDGLRAKGPININKASEEELQTLPGVTPKTASKIIAGRPYRNAVELRDRRILPRAIYNRIATKVQAR